MRYPSLDGLRAVSISLVIAHHLGVSSLPVIWRLDIGNLGVRTFFVISGFLITSLLLAEREKVGRIDINAFYLRRLFRIVPAYWVFLAAMAVAVPFSALLPSLLYYANYSHPALLVGHTWSLSVEEQFYLIWPLALLWRPLWAVGAMLVLAPLMRHLADQGLWPVESRYAWECVCDALAAGCLLALVRDKLPYRPNAWIAGAAALGCAALQWLWGLNLAIALVIDAVIRQPPKVLNVKPVVWLGTLSYSLYLWQQPFMVSALPWWAKVAGSVGVACLSYYLIERPILRWRQQQLRRDGSEAKKEGLAGRPQNAAPGG